MTDLEAMLARAWQHYQAGKLGQAEALCRQVLAAAPQSVNALYLLGSICLVGGRVEESIPLYQRALEVNPNVAEIYTDLGTAHVSQGRLTEAIACYRQAIHIRPDYAEAFNNLGLVQSSRQEWSEATDAYRRALALKPQFPEALNNLGIALFHQQEVAEAIRVFREALALMPQYAEALNNLGNALLFQGKHTEAGDCYRQALRLRPDNAPANNNLAGVHRALRQWDEAVACLQKSLTLKPNNPATHRNLGKVYYDLGNYPEALTCYRHVLRLCPNDAEAQFWVETLPGQSAPSQLSPEAVTSWYDEAAARWEEDWVQRFGWRSPELLKAPLAPAPAERSLAVVDLGCGTGLCGAQFRDWAHTLTGVDLSPKMLDRARKRGIYDELIVGDLLLPLQRCEASFDLVLASDVLLLIGDLEPIFRAAYKGLRPGGRFAFTLYRLEKGTGYRLLPYGEFAHSQDYLQELATRTHWQKIAMYPVVFPGESHQGAADLVVVLSRN